MSCSANAATATVRSRSRSPLPNTRPSAALRPAFSSSPATPTLNVTASSELPNVPHRGEGGPRRRDRDPPRPTPNQAKDTMTSLETQPRKRAGVIGERAKLVIFYSPTSGSCRRAEGYLAEVLQRRRNHDTLQILRVNADRN